MPKGSAEPRCGPVSRARRGSAAPRIAILGAGFSGLCVAARLQRAGWHDFTIFERAAEVGGTWRDNTYPGCACDIPSHLYSFSFAPDPDWSRVYPPQEEIERYLVRVTDRLSLRKKIRFGTEIRELRFDEATCRWTLFSAEGERFVADIVVSATGPLSRPAIPALPGLESFEGTVFHSARWRHDHDLAGRRVAVVGTGASAIQIVPAISRRVAKLHVFQRTAPWVVPRRDRAISSRERSLYRRMPFLQRLHRWTIYWRQELGAFAILGNGRLRSLFEREARRFLRQSVADPALRRAVTPNYAIGCKRILISNEWYPALQRDNVELVSEAIERVTARGIVTRDGCEREVDTLILATGFAATEFLAPMRVFGQGGVELADAWKDGAATHLGITTAGFPDFFMIVGPGTGLGHNSIVFMMEAQACYVLGAIRHRARVRADALVLDPAVQDASYRALQERMKRTVWLSGCESWYRSADGRIDTLWPGFTIDYWWRTRRFRASAFRALRATAS